MFKPNFLLIPTEVIQDPDIKPLDCTVYGIVYWYHSLKDGVCFAGNPAIAEIACATPRGVQNSLTRLEKKCYIKRFYGPKGRQIVPRIVFSSNPSIRFEGEDPLVECFYCHKKDKHGNSFDMDHYVPKSKGGSDEKDNMVLCCKECNAVKGDLTGDEYISYLQQNISSNDDTKDEQSVTSRSSNDDKNNNIYIKNKSKNIKPKQFSRMFFDDSEIQEQVLDEVLVKIGRGKEFWVRHEMAKFVDYWTEQTDSGKGLWETKRVFDLRRRFGRWLRTAAERQNGKIKSKGKKIIV